LVTSLGRKEGNVPEEKHIKIILDMDKIGKQCQKLQPTQSKNGRFIHKAGRSLHPARTDISPKFSEDYKRSLCNHAILFKKTGLFKAKLCH
jgi:hypothetical protein